MRASIASLALACVALGSGVASAYPTSVVFAPTGDAKGGGDVGMLAYSSVFLHPGVFPGPSYLGFNVGVLPRLKVGESGPELGGLEIGVDLTNADLMGTPDAFIKPVFNAKLQIIGEYKWVPHISFGVMQVAPFRLDRSLNAVYGSMTKTLRVGETSLGRLTLGLWGAARPFDKAVFYATGPFNEDSQLALLAGYESPALGPLSFAIDYIGGVSEVSSTNVALNLSPFDGATWGVGGYVGNDYQNFFGGAFTYLYVSWNVFKAFGPKRPDPAASPPPATNAAPSSTSWPAMPSGAPPPGPPPPADPPRP